LSDRSGRRAVSGKEAESREWGFRTFNSSNFRAQKKQFFGFKAFRAGIYCFAVHNFFAATGILKVVAI
jgi:hypothetical protein